MSPELWYCSQASLIAFFALVLYSRRYRIEVYPLFMTIAWLIGVCVIYLEFGDAQTDFYSNDQAVHLLIIQVVIPNSQNALDEFVGFRYLLTVPAFILSKIGLNPILVIKAFQLFSLLGIYTTSKKIIQKHGFTMRLWHFIFVASPLMFFFSLLALRDVILAFFFIQFAFDSRATKRLLMAFLVFLLKPHLAAAILFGWVAVMIFQKIRSRFNVFNRAILISVSYVLGSLAYSVGSFIRDSFFPGLPNQVFSQDLLGRVALNFSGLQFIALLGEDRNIVASSLTELLISRLVLADTFLIPITFLIVSFGLCWKLKHEALFIGSSFLFYLGLVLQTDFNSTRQNLPFLAAMGIIVVVNIEYSRAKKQKNADAERLAETF
jgi:hypothetical protein